MRASTQGRAPPNDYFHTSSSRDPETACFNLYTLFPVAVEFPVVALSTFPAAVTPPLCCDTTPPAPAVTAPAEIMLTGMISCLNFASTRTNMRVKRKMKKAQAANQRSAVAASVPLEA